MVSEVYAAGGGRRLIHEGELKVERDGHVLILTLNRPQHLNSLSLAVREGLRDQLGAAQADPDVRCVVITGAGRAFCSGADVAALENAATSGPPAARTQVPFTPRHCRLYKPSIVAVNGVCASAGLHFLTDCDIAVGAESSTYLDTHVNVGQVMAQEAIGLARRLPMSVALRMMILGRDERLTAGQALAHHLISEVVPDDRLMDRAMELAQIASRGSPAALQGSLRAFWHSFEGQMERDNEAAYEIILGHRSHPDAAEGARAFREKRAPRWTV